MHNLRPNTEADRAAEAFYGQSEALFSLQIAQICRNDTRLIAAFERTREHYTKTKPAQRN